MFSFYYLISFFFGGGGSLATLRATSAEANAYINMAFNANFDSIRPTKYHRCHKKGQDFNVAHAVTIFHLVDSMLLLPSISRGKLSRRGRERSGFLRRLRSIPRVVCVCVCVCVCNLIAPSSCGGIILFRDAEKEIEKREFKREKRREEGRERAIFNLIFLLLGGSSREKGKSMKHDKEEEEEEENEMGKI